MRYVIFNTESGRVIDDGTVVRLAEDAYFVTTSSGGVDLVNESFGLWRRSAGSTSTSSTSPARCRRSPCPAPRRARILARVTELDLSGEAFPFLGARQGVVAGVPALVMRIGFLGELGYELHFPSAAAVHVWDALLEAGADAGILPVGVEALKVLRLEKGHIIVGIDTDSETTMLELGMDRMVVWDKGAFVGRDALERMHARGADRRLVGFRSERAAARGNGRARRRGDRRARHERALKYRGGRGDRPRLRAGRARRRTERGSSSTWAEARPASATVHTRAFVDPDGERLRA